MLDRLAAARAPAAAMLDQLVSSALSRPWSCCCVAAHAPRRAGTSGLCEDAARSRGPAPSSGRSPRRIVQQVDAADHLVDRAEAELRHDARAAPRRRSGRSSSTCSGLPAKRLAQLRVLRGHADRAGVQVALAHHDAARARPAARCRSRTPRRPAARRSTTSRPVLQLAVDLRRGCGRAGRSAPAPAASRPGPSSQGRPACLMRRERRGAGAAVVAADQHHVGLAPWPRRPRPCRRRPRRPASR